MKIYAISDLHLSNSVSKPMDIFGGNWENYVEKVQANWNAKISDEDIVLVAGDISWAMKLEDAVSDLEWIDRELLGKKIIIKGNHEYWWKSISAVREVLPNSVIAIQNDAVKIGNFVICGTRGWNTPEHGKEFSDEDMKIYKREVERLKLTLAYATTMKQEGDIIIAMMHFPPFVTGGEETEFTKLFEQAGVKKVVFGHIHGYTNCPLKTTINGVEYLFTSCDHIKNDPVLVWEE